MEQREITALNVHQLAVELRRKIEPTVRVLDAYEKEMARGGPVSWETERELREQLHAKSIRGKLGWWEAAVAIARLRRRSRS